MEKLKLKPFFISENLKELLNQGLFSLLFKVIREPFINCSDGNRYFILDLFSKFIPKFKSTPIQLEVIYKTNNNNCLVFTSNKNFNEKDEEIIMKRLFCIEENEYKSNATNSNSHYRLISELIGNL